MRGQCDNVKVKLRGLKIHITEQGVEEARDAVDGGGEGRPRPLDAELERRDDAGRHLVEVRRRLLFATSKIHAQEYPSKVVYQNKRLLSFCPAHYFLSKAGRYFSNTLHPTLVTMS